MPTHHATEPAMTATQRNGADDPPDPLKGSALKRLNYLTHRWIGIVLGLMVFVWFGSGIVMMYYPYPALTESQRLAQLHAYEPDDHLVGFARAAAAYGRAPGAREGTSQTRSDGAAVVGARLELWDGRLVYRLYGEAGVRTTELALVDAHSGEILTPIAPEPALRVARDVTHLSAALDTIELLSRSDHYFMGNEHRAAFPVYRVRFADDQATAVYVSRNSGAAPAVVTRVTRITTWLGTVPHWLYFMSLYYDHPDTWIRVNLILPGVAVVLALTGIILGVYQLFPRRRRREWRLSGYHGMSLWHHVAGVICGLLVLTWALSGFLEVLGVGNDPRAGQAARARAGDIRWAAIRIPEAAALKTLRAFATGTVIPRAIDLVQLDGRPGYKFHLDDGRAFWIDADDGAPRSELSPERVTALAGRVVGAGIVGVERIDRYDAYYYARHGREKHLPAWRVRFDDPSRSVLYLDTVSGTPVGFVDAATRSWRWWRDGLHDLDLPALNNKRPWWDLVVLPLMIGGTISAITGVWLLFRRLRRMRVL